MSAPYFLSLIEGSVLLLPVEYDYVMEQGDDFGVDNEHMLYCGAYYISEFQRDKKIVLTKNPHYWDVDSVTLDTIDYQMIPDGTTALEMFKRGEISSCTVEGEEYLSLVGSEWEQYLAPNDFSSSTNYLWLNFKSKNPEFAKFIENENFRKALQYSVDRETIAYLREPVDPSRVVRNTIIAERLIYDDEGVDYTDYPGLKEIKETDYYNPEKAREYMLAAIEELCDENGNILRGKVRFIHRFGRHFLGHTSGHQRHKQGHNQKQSKYPFHDSSSTIPEYRAEIQWSNYKILLILYILSSLLK